MTLFCNFKVKNHVVGKAGQIGLSREKLKETGERNGRDRTSRST